MTKALLLYCLVVAVFTGVGFGVVMAGEGRVGWVVLLVGLSCAVTGARTLLGERKRQRQQADGPR